MKKRNCGIVAVMLLGVLIAACSGSDDASEPRTDAYIRAKVDGIQTELSYTAKARRNIEGAYNLEIIGSIPREKNKPGIMRESIMMVIFESEQEITTGTYPLDGDIDYKMMALYNITKTDSTQTNFSAVSESSAMDNNAFEITISKMNGSHVSGTFKGVLYHYESENGGKILEISNGEFTVPVMQDN